MANGMGTQAATLARTGSGLGAPAPSTASGMRAPIGALMRMKSGARWFYWVAVLSVVNTAITFSGARLHFLLGLGATDFVAGIAKNSGPGGAGTAFVIEIMIAVAFVLTGIWATRCNQFAFGMGMLLYAADGALLVLTHSWVGLAFHVVALTCMYRGFAAARELRGIAALGQVNR